MASESGSIIEHGVLVRQWKWPLRMAFWWATIGVCVWAFAVAAHWGWSKRYAPDRPLTHADQVVRQELATLTQLRPYFFEPLAAAALISTSIYDGAVGVSVWVSRAVMNWTPTMRLNAASPAMRNDADPGGDFVRRLLENPGEDWLMVVATTQIFATRTATYLCALPMLVLIASLSVVDGLVARAKRKACAGHESASLYHRAKLGVSFVAILGYLIFVGLPAVPKPEHLLLPLALTLALLLRVQTTYYKKYL